MHDDHVLNTIVQDLALIAVERQEFTRKDFERVRDSMQKFPQRQEV